MYQCRASHHCCACKHISPHTLTNSRSASAREGATMCVWCGVLLQTGCCSLLGALVRKVASPQHAARAHVQNLQRDGTGRQQRVFEKEQQLG